MYEAMPSQPASQAAVRLLEKHKHVDPSYPIIAIMSSVRVRAESRFVLVFQSNEERAHAIHSLQAVEQIREFASLVTGRLRRRGGPFSVDVTK